MPLRTRPTIDGRQRTPCPSRSIGESHGLLDPKRSRSVARPHIRNGSCSRRDRSGTRPGRMEAIRDRDLAAVSAKLRAHGLAAGLRARARSVHQRRLRRAAERGQEEYSGSHETPHAPRVPYPHRRGCFPAGTPKRTVRAHGCETDRLSQPHNSQIQRAHVDLGRWRNNPKEWHE